MQGMEAMAQATKLTPRRQAMMAWAESLFAECQIEYLAGDASFRRYFRLTVATKSYVVMDAPPEVERSHSFVLIAKALADCGVKTPQIISQDLEQGFLLLEDLGDVLYLSTLSAANADQLYGKALQSLLKIAQCQKIPDYELPVFSRQRYLEELVWFEQWYVDQYIERPLSVSQRAVLQEMFDLIVNQALAQPQVLVHKDYHSRNLLLLENGAVGVIDFQDALIGPITYDLMSLLYDHYIAWPYEKVVQWARLYQQQLLQAGLLQHDDMSEFMRWHDWLALQRIMKNLGNFVRLKLLHNKPAYYQDIPRIYQYLLDITQRYPELAPLASLLQCYRPEALR